MVTKFLSDSEIITVAMNLEEEGYSFYNEVSKAAKRGEARDIFARLRDDEQDHYKTFKELLESLQADSKSYFNIDNAVALYLESLVETRVFKGIDRVSIKNLSEIDALQTGIKVERDSILFYTEAQKASVNPKGRDIMSRIIEIEKTHLVTLANRLRVARKLF